MTYIVVWIFGQTFTLRISDAILDRVMPTLLNARVDGFFDKQPNGRILNRLSADLYTVDYLLFARITQTLGLLERLLMDSSCLFLAQPRRSWWKDRVRQIDGYS